MSLMSETQQFISFWKVTVWIQHPVSFLHLFKETSVRCGVCRMAMSSSRCWHGWWSNSLTCSLEGHCKVDLIVSPCVCLLLPPLNSFIGVFSLASVKQAKYCFSLLFLKCWHYQNHLGSLSQNSQPCNKILECSARLQEICLTFRAPELSLKGCRSCRFQQVWMTNRSQNLNPAELNIQNQIHWHVKSTFFFPLDWRCVTMVAKGSVLFSITNKHVMELQTFTSETVLPSLLPSSFPSLLSFIRSVFVSVVGCMLCSADYRGKEKGCDRES